MPMPLIANMRFVNYTGEETDHMLQEGSCFIVKKRTSGAPPGYHSPKSRRNKTDSEWLKLIIKHFNGYVYIIHIKCVISMLKIYY